MYLSFSSLPEVRPLSLKDRMALHQSISTSLKLGSLYTRAFLLSFVVSLFSLGGFVKLGFSGDLLAYLGLGVMFVFWGVLYVSILNTKIHAEVKKEIARRSGYE